MTPYLLENAHTIVLDSRKGVMYNEPRKWGSMNYVKVKHPALKKAVYLENPKTIIKHGHTFVSGHVVNKQGDPVIVKGGSVMHLLEVGEGVQIIPQKFNPKYAELEDAQWELLIL